MIPTMRQPSQLVIHYGVHLIPQLRKEMRVMLISTQIWAIQWVILSINILHHTLKHITKKILNLTIFKIHIFFHLSKIQKIWELCKWLTSTHNKMSKSQMRKNQIMKKKWSTLHMLFQLHRSKLIKRINDTSYTLKTLLLRNRTGKWTLSLGKWKWMSKKNLREKRNTLLMGIGFLINWQEMSQKKMEIIIF